MGSCAAAAARRCCGPPLPHLRVANASWLNRIEAQFTALRYFTVDGTDHPSHAEQASMIRRYIAWGNHYTRDRRLRKPLLNKSWFQTG